MAQNNEEVGGGYISIPLLTRDKSKRTNLYRLIREKRLIEGKDYKIITREIKVIVVRKNILK